MKEAFVKRIARLLVDIFGNSGGSVSHTDVTTPPVSGDTGAVMEEILLKDISNIASFKDVVRYVASVSNANFDKSSDCGKRTMEKLVGLAEERAGQCTSFQEAYGVYCIELEPVHSLERRLNYSPLRDLTMPVYRRVRELARQQTKDATQKMDLVLLARLYDEAKRVDGFYNFEVAFESAIWNVVNKKLKDANNIDSLVALYKSTKDANCDFAGRIVSAAMAEFLLKEKGSRLY